MKTGTFLDLDMASIGELLRDAWRWWIDELSGLVPRRLQAQEPPMQGLIVQTDVEGGLSVDGADLTVGEGRLQAATILLPETQVLIRNISLPKLRQADLQKLVALDLDRLMPFPAGSAYSDVAVTVTETNADGTLQARIAALPKAQLLGWYQTARDFGLAPRAIGIANENGETMEFDFLPALVADGQAIKNSGAQHWWILVAALFFANVGLMVWKDVQSVARLQALVDVQQPLVSAARKLSLRLTREDATRSELIETRQQDNALSALAFVTRSMPAGAWVQRYSWNGEVLRISGYKQDKVDVLNALRKTGAFASVRASTSDVAAESATGQPFDVTAEWKR